MGESSPAPPQGLEASQRWAWGKALEAATRSSLFGWVPLWEAGGVTLGLDPGRGKTTHTAWGHREMVWMQLGTWNCDPLYPEVSERRVGGLGGDAGCQATCRRRSELAGAFAGNCPLSLSVWKCLKKVLGEIARAYTFPSPPTLELFFTQLVESSQVGCPWVPTHPVHESQIGRG